MFGSEKLTGVVKQEVDMLTGEISYKGIMHFFGSKLPIHIQIRPTKYSLKGKRLFYIYSFLPEQEARCDLNERELQRTLVKARVQSERKVKELLNKIGIIYDEEKRKRTTQKTDRKRKKLSK